MGIRTRLLLLVLCAVLPALGIILHDGIENRRAAIERAEMDARMLADAAGFQQEQLTASIRQMLATLAQLPAVQSLDSASCLPLFRHLLRQNPYLSNLLLTDPNGMAVASALAASPFSVGERPYFQEARRTGDFSVGEYATGMATGQPSLHFALSVRDAGGRTIGVLVAALNLHGYSDVMDDTPLPPSAFLTVADRNGIRLCSQPPRDSSAPLGGPIPADVWGAASGPAQAGAMRSTDADGQRRIIAYKQLRLQPDMRPYVYVMAGIPEALALERANAVLGRNLGLLLLAGVLAMGTAWHFGGAIFVRRLERLSNAAKAIGQGLLNVRAEGADVPDTMGELAASFNSMAEALQKRAEQSRADAEALRRSGERYRLLAENSHDYICELDSAGRCLLVTRSYTLGLGYTAEELLGKQMIDATVHPDDREKVRLRAARVRDGGERLTMEFRALDKNGGCRWLETTLSAYDTGEGERRLVAMSRDITERRAFEKELTRHAYHDPLTELPNRVLFIDRLDQTIKLAQRGGGGLSAVLYLDLDRFKVVNDSLGHDVGDKLLQAVGQALRECVREHDTVARLGGDEFALLLTNLRSRREIVRTVKRIQRRLGQRLPVSGREFSVKASIGIVVGVGAKKPGDKGPEGVMRDADIAMYHAKARGAGRFKVFTPRMREQAVRLMTMEYDLKRAIEEGEIEVFYQPVISMDTGSLYGLEALVRWRRPGHGIVSPAEFVPLAEETGLILPLGRMVLTEACGHAGLWRHLLAGRSPLCLHVNLSPRQFLDPHFCQEVERLIETLELPPGFLNLEITETALMENARAASSILDRLKSMGASLSLDDFGTGYSSLGSLHDFPVDLLKIDRTFVREIDHNKRAAEVARTIVTLAKVLDKAVIAEGVETVAQARTLMDLGCVLGQGFLFSRPVSVEDTDAAIRSIMAGNHPFVPAPLRAALGLAPAEVPAAQPVATPPQVV